MNVTDLQNPLSSMPLMQQMQQTQNQQAQLTPVAFVQNLQEEIRDELTTVKETKEQNEKDRINEEDQRGDIRKKLPRRRARPVVEAVEEKEQPKPRAKDGIHGRYLDIQI